MSIAALREGSSHATKLNAFAGFPSDAEPNSEPMRGPVHLSEVHSPASSRHSTEGWNSDEARENANEDASSPVLNLSKQNENIEYVENSRNRLSEKSPAEPENDKFLARRDSESSLTICEDDVDRKRKEETEFGNGGISPSIRNDSTANEEIPRSTEPCQDGYSHIATESKDELDANGESVISLAGFSHYFSHNLYTLQQRNLFCDVILRAQNMVIYSHKVVLAACSPYFYNKLRQNVGLSNNRESGVQIIDLDDSLANSGLEAIIDCMYTSKIKLNASNVHQVLHTSSHLNMQLVVNACLRFLHSQNAGFAPQKQYEGPSQIKNHDSENEKQYEEAINLSVSTQKQSSIPERSSPCASSPEIPGDYTHNCNDNKQEKNQTVEDMKEIKSINAKSINWKKHKYITQNLHRTNIEGKRDVPTVEAETNGRLESRNVKCESSLSPEAYSSPNKTAATTDDNDDVFVHKLGQEKSPVNATPTALMTNHNGYFPGMTNLAFDILRRHHRDMFSRGVEPSPYLLTPDAMAVAMSPLNPAIRSPVAPTFMTRPLHDHRFDVKPWQQIFGQRYQQMPTNGHHLPPPFDAFSAEARKQRAASIEEEALRKQNTHYPNPAQRHGLSFNPLMQQGSRHFSVNPKDENLATYNPLLLKRLLESTESQSFPKTAKRPSSDASPDSIDIASVPRKRFSDDRPVCKDESDFRRSLGESAESQTKQRRSTTSSSGSPDRPYKCLVCAAEFNRPANLKTHMRIHSGEKPYKCHSCGARFVQVAHLRAHILIHTGEKPYPCKICGTRFRHLQTLKSHLRIHTGEKPYACEECKVRFRHKSQLRLHLRTKHGINTNTKKTYKQIPGLNSADICAHIRRTQEAVRMQAVQKKVM